MSHLLTPTRRAAVYFVVLVCVWGMLNAKGGGASARDPAGDVDAKAAPAPAGSDQQHRLADAEKLAEATLSAQAKPAAAAAAKPAGVDLSVWELYQKGGVLMYPITVLSFVVVCFGLERFLGLRRRKVVPRRLVRGLREVIARPGAIDVNAVFEYCRRFPSAAANVVAAMLADPSPTMADMERTAKDASDREATRLYFNVRWLNLAMSVAPMLGLLGTVQGMIIVFMGASHLPPGANKAEYMAQGIYLKLVCTFAGLIVAIPAAVLSYLFEARIQSLMSDVEDLALVVQRQAPRIRNPQPKA